MLRKPCGVFSCYELLGAELSIRHLISIGAIYPQEISFIICIQVDLKHKNKHGMI